MPYAAITEVRRLIEEMQDTRRKRHPSTVEQRRYDGLCVEEAVLLADLRCQGLPPCPV
jgi:hypothetical protein